MYNHLVKHYEAPPLPGNPRATESWAFLQAALRMRRAKDSKDRSEIQAAARLNWRLWTIIQAELMAPECQVPLGIRNNMLSLAAFVDKHTLVVLAKPDPDELDVLINVNREISAGLSTTPQEEAQAAQTVPQTGVSA